MKSNFVSASPQGPPSRERGRLDNASKEIVKAQKSNNRFLDEKRDVEEGLYTPWAPGLANHLSDIHIEQPGISHEA